MGDRLLDGSDGRLSDGLYDRLGGSVGLDLGAAVRAKAGVGSELKPAFDAKHG